MGSQGVTRAVWILELHTALHSAPIKHALRPTWQGIQQRNVLQFLGENSRVVELKAKLGTAVKVNSSLPSCHSPHSIPRNDARGEGLKQFSQKFFEPVDASLPLAIITLGSRTDSPRGRFVTRWCLPSSKRLPMWTAEGALASHLKDASTKRFSAAALCVFLPLLCKYFFHSPVSISAASRCGYFPLICDSDLAR